MLVTDVVLCAPPKLPSCIGAPTFDPTPVLGSRCLIATGDDTGEFMALDAGRSDEDTGVAACSGVVPFPDAEGCVRADTVGGVGWVADAVVAGAAGCGGVGGRAGDGAAVAGVCGA